MRKITPRRENLDFAFYFLGVVYLALGLVMLGLEVLSLLLGETPWGFLVGSVLGIGLGLLFRRLGDARSEPSRAEALFSLALIWLLVPLLGAVPFWVSGGMHYLDALFEAMSGFTTTGATALADFGSWGYGLFLWRSLIQWFGGVGILVLLASVLSHLAIAGRQLFMAESTGVQKEPFTPRLRVAAQSVLKVYVVLTVACAVCYALAGMPLFEAVCNALTTLPAAGFSPNPQSFAAYSPLAQWFGTLFMFLAGTNFVLQYQLFLRREPLPIVRNIEFRVYTLVVLVFSLGLAAFLMTHHQEDMNYSWSEALRHAFFNVTSLITTTGYASADFALWAPAAQAILVLAMFVGGCSGSGAGGVKVIRWLVIGALARRELLRALQPQAVLTLRVGSKVLSEDVMRSVAGFITLYVVLFGASTVALTLLENDYVLGLTASAQAIGNVGPGLGEIGPMGSFANLQPFSKLILIFEMWAGRIELIPVFLLLTPELWRRLRS
ncbi:Trk system potassium uptake protein TrkG [Calidithermus terrae]|uniref:Trk system potassium uptake protein TrkG n=1 Tax=Calidithermus terrae TaxID=1408545 RepID=A0A399F4F6_9DEIN|nr:TrkH family potassium uptake protein [Calidithermus terrae]RIH90546.1 Trk system potassium uptake protein TrkG [Calidithermus terrae]